MEVLKSSGTHQNQKREVQQLSINPDLVRERSKVVFDVTDPSDHLMYIYDLDIVRWGPYVVNLGMSESNFKTAIKDFWIETASNDLTITKTMYDDSGVEVGTLPAAGTVKFIIQYNKAING